jgi:hypothetical protein
VNLPEWVKVHKPVNAFLKGAWDALTVWVKGKIDRHVNFNEKHR